MMRAEERAALQGFSFAGLIRRNREVVMKTNKVLSIGMMVVVMLMSSCHRQQVIPDSLKAHVNQTVTFEQIKSSPTSYQGKLVVLGGEVLSATRLEGITRVEVLQLPLTDDLAPMMERTYSKGRFMAFDTGQKILNPAILEEGTPVTIVGEVKPPAEAPVGERQYEFPTLVIRDVTVWAKDKAGSAPLTYYGSPHGYGYRPYYFSGIYGVHGLD